MRRDRERTGLLSAPATRPEMGYQVDPLTVILQPLTMQPFATLHPTRAVWGTHQPDLFGRQAPYSETWPTCGMTHDGSAYRLHFPALITIASVSSSSPTAGALFRTPLATDSSRGGETMETVRARGGTIALSHQIIDLALNGPGGSTINSNAAETLFALVDSIFVAGGDTPTPSHDGSTSPDAAPLPPQF